MMMPTTPLKELFNLEECESNDDADVANPIHEDNWLFQTRRKL